jgi:hypothetical protein
MTTSRRPAPDKNQRPKKSTPRGAIRRAHLAVLCLPASGALALLALAGINGCGSAPIACAGQCAPPYELQVDFHPGTTHTTAQKLLGSCADHDPVVIRVGTLRDLGGGISQAMIYTHVFGDTPRTTRLLKCLRTPGIATAGWPD